MEPGRVESSMTKLENRHSSATVSLTGSTESDSSFTSTVTSGSRRGPPSSESEHSLPLKRARLAEAVGKPAVGDGQLFFKKFVNTALDEKLKVGFLILLV